MKSQAHPIIYVAHYEPEFGNRRANVPKTRKFKKCNLPLAKQALVVYNVTVVHLRQHADVAQMVEHILGKDVFFRSSFTYTLS